MVEGGKKGIVTNRPQSDVTLELVGERAMTDTEIEAIASLLFTWWKREFEQQGNQDLQSKLRER